MKDMTCYCGRRIPHGTPKFPIKEEEVKMIYALQGEAIEIKTTETHIVKCADKDHTEGSEWNFADQAEYRADQPRAKKLLRKR